MALRRYIAIFCTLLMLCTISAPMISKLTCNQSGSVHLTVGQVDLCCAPESSRQDVLRGICCEMEELSMELDEMLFQTYSFDEDVSSDVAIAYPDVSLVLKGRIVAYLGLRAPPVVQESVRILYGVFRL